MQIGAPRLPGDLAQYQDGADGALVTMRLVAEDEDGPGVGRVGIAEGSLVGGIAHADVEILKGFVPAAARIVEAALQGFVVGEHHDDEDPLPFADDRMMNLSHYVGGPCVPVEEQEMPL